MPIGSTMSEIINISEFKLQIIPRDFEQESPLVKAWHKTSDAI